MNDTRFWFAGVLTLITMGWPQAVRAVEPAGIVYQSEAISTPASAWQTNKRSADHWTLWTQEPNIERKRSGGAVLVSPVVSKDRTSPEEGALPLHSVVTDLKPGVYRVYVSNPGRPLACSLDGKTWFKYEARELSLGTRHITDGRFEFWVDDRYAHPADNPGPAYYDYVRFVPVPASTMNVERTPVWPGLDHWLRTQCRGTTIPARQMNDPVGFVPDRDDLKGSKAGDRFSYVFDRSGTFYVAVTMSDDSDSVEQLRVDLNGKEIACLIGDGPQDTTCLFTIKQPVKVAPGDKLTFTCLADLKSCRVSTICLGEAPITPPPPAIEHVETWSPNPGEADLCWTTSAIAKTGCVEYGPVGDKVQSVYSDYQGRNHRVRLRKLDPAREYEATIRTEHQGKPVASAPIRFRASPPTPPPTRPLTIELTVPEPTDRPRQNWPATVGIPFSKGALAKGQDLRLFDCKGKELPLQVETFSRWADGSIKWGTISFLADTTTGTPDRYALKAQPAWGSAAPTAGDTVRIDQADRTWRVCTDTLAFDIDKSSPAAFHNVGFDRNGDGRITDDERTEAKTKSSGLALQTGDGSFLTCGPPDREGLTLEVNGPVRAVLKWSGPLVSKKSASGWMYLIRLTLWKGQPVIGLNVSVWNDQPSPTFRELGSLEWHVPLTGKNLKGSLEGCPFETVPDADGLWIHQDRDNRYRLHAGDKNLDGQRAIGVAAATDGRTQVTAVVRDFWQSYPGGFAITRDGLHVRLLPRLSADTYNDLDDPKWFCRLYAWFSNGNYLVRSGQLTQHDLYIRYDRPGNDLDARTFAAWMSQPLLPQATPEYLCGTGAIGRPLFPRTQGVWDSYEACFERGFQNLLKDREQRRTYGWMHYGDWFGERILNFGNNEYDLNWAMGLQWMRCGDRRYFDRGLQMARHFTTVDTLHGASADKSSCLVWEHSFNHVGSGLKTSQLRFQADDKEAQDYLKQYGGMFGGARDPMGHIYETGNWLYAALTGDRWFRDVAERVCTHQAERLTPAYNFGIERCGGWPLINAAGAYAFSGNPYYLNAARLMIERCLERQDPATGGWLHYPPIGETEGVRVLGGKAFAVGILSHGILRYLDQEPQDRPEVRRMLVRAAGWLMNESWIPGKGFRYITNAPNYRNVGARGSSCNLNAEVVAFAYEQTRDPKYLAFWQEMLKGSLDNTPTGMGKSFTQAVRQIIYGLDRVRPWGITTLPASAGR